MIASICVDYMQRLGPYSLFCLSTVFQKVPLVSLKKGRAEPHRAAEELFFL